MLIVQEVPPDQGFVEMLILGIPLLTRNIVTRIDPALCAHRMRSFHRDHREEIYSHSCFGDPDTRRESRESASDYNHSFFVCHVVSTSS